MLQRIKETNGNVQNIESIPESLKHRYKEAFDIDPKWLIKLAAHRGKWIDQSQSLNLFTSTSSGNELSEMYLYAWRMGLKSTYYLRTLAASNVEKSTLEAIPNKTVALTADSPTLAHSENSIIACRIDGHAMTESKECEACQ